MQTHQPDFESTPLTRPEYISALVHLYRGEMSRANVWRTRLDTTTNWAILTTMGLLSFAFSGPDHSHATLVVGMLMLVHFLVVESRRYLFFDVWRQRVRMIEETFYNPLLSRDLKSPKGGWGRAVAEDLLHPSFKMTYLQAFRTRLVRNYVGLFGLLLASWLVKVTLHPFSLSDHPEAWRSNMALGPIAWWVVVGFILALYSVLAFVLVRGRGHTSEEELHWTPQETRLLSRDHLGL